MIPIKDKYQRTVIGLWLGESKVVQYFGNVAQFKQPWVLSPWS